MGTSLPSKPSVIRVSYTSLFSTQSILKHFKAKILTFRFDPPQHKSGGTCYAFRKNKNCRVFGSFAFAVFVHEIHEILKNFANRRIQLRTRTCNAFCTNKIFAKLTLKNVCEDLVCYAFFAQINSKIFTPTFLFSKNRR